MEWFVNVVNQAPFASNATIPTLSHYIMVQISAKLFLPAKPNFASAPKRQNPFLFPCYGKQLNKKEQSSPKFLNSSINVLLWLEGTYPYYYQKRLLWKRLFDIWTIYFFFLETFNTSFILTLNVSPKPPKIFVSHKL